MTWKHHGMLIDDRRRDAAWWCDGSEDVLVHELSDGGRHVSVRRLGRMLIVKDSGEEIRTFDDLEAMAVRDDEELDALDPSVWEWVNNAWFEVIVDDQPEGVIAHTIDEALDEAARVLGEVAA